ncbi:hypothetical protein JDV02_000030 [Purpureocillium takamizusanense]|uniref:Uncharacterized protein n=1 Tax=Purpureocillium takamizusanense TaxID=2060973 RepID=A0A9Q8Q6K3_9HYPO|nr:uncharacterized protein JDV02_000030 [Purpureocillium takamizusanense]UNI13273.1 hypothetical protein JDV02_000030 [Purpureocillium takamizusanense]
MAHPRPHDCPPDCGYAVAQHVRGAGGLTMLSRRLLSAPRSSRVPTAPSTSRLSQIRCEFQPSRLAPMRWRGIASEPWPVVPNTARGAAELTEPSIRYHFQPNFHGMNKTSAFRLGLRTASFGGAGVIAALLYVSGIPRVQRDILQQIPVVGKYFIPAEIPASDNPF